MKPAVPALIAAAVALSGCGYFWPFADDRARASVEAMNLADVRLSRTMLGLNCGKSDKIHYKFTAHNLSGRTVHGVVCMSYFKGATVRITG